MLSNEEIEVVKKDIAIHKTIRVLNTQSNKFYDIIDIVKYNSGSYVVKTSCGKLFSIHNISISQKDFDLSLLSLNKKNVEEKNKKKEEKMSTNLVSGAVNKLVDNVKSDGVDAAWRAAARQTVRAAKEPLAAFLVKQKLSPNVAAWLTSQSDTELGEAVLALVMGFGMSYVPHLQTDKKLVRLSKELRVLGMEHFMTRVAEVMLLPLRKSLVEIVAGVPLAEELPAV